MNKKFSHLSVQQRVARLVQLGYLKAHEAQHLLSKQALDTRLAEQCIENVVGYFQLPIGVAEGFVVNGAARMIPMAVEETSIVAAASKTAKWIQKCGGSIRTRTVSQWAHGQIQIPQVQNINSFVQKIKEHKHKWIQKANTYVAAGLVARGAGVQDIQVRVLKPQAQAHAHQAHTPQTNRAQDTKSLKPMVVLHIYIDVCDAMGANIINQTCEFLKPFIERATGEKAGLCIVSNLADKKISRAEVVVPHIDAQLGTAIEQASEFAHTDPYRACTSNKGVLNGIDAVLIATGNDWRAVEAGLHAWAARDTQYRSLTTWSVQDNKLVGYMEGPFMLGTVGGVTTLHPTARAMLSMMGVKKASHLAELCAAVGLVQNLGALRALVTQGIVEGHMRLHCKNLAAHAGATQSESPEVVQSLQAVLKQKKHIGLREARQCLAQLRA